MIPFYTRTSMKIFTPLTVVNIFGKLELVSLIQLLTILASTTIGLKF